jgi:aerobic-type carbon monoxide dehydrogenase small subunit (CoxS/CutS family)
MKIAVALTLNGTPRTLLVEPGEILLDSLRAAGCFGVKRGCETGTCGSCVVLVDGEPRYSCLLFAAGQAGRSITTIEALDTPEKRDPIIESFVAEGAVQCGYCVPGMVLSAKALLDQNPSPTEEEVRVAIDGHLCRCTGYLKQVKAILRAAALRQAEKEAR